MTDLRQAAQQALEALLLPTMKTQQMLIQRDEAIIALRRALEQQAERVMLNGLTETETNATASVMGLTKQAEPVAWSYDISTTMMDHGYDGWEHRITRYKPNVPEGSIRSLTPLYTTPPQRQWVGLTDEEITELRLKNFDAVATNYESYRAIEAKLKEKNSD